MVCGKRPESGIKPKRRELDVMLQPFTTDIALTSLHYEQQASEECSSKPADRGTC